MAGEINKLMKCISCNTTYNISKLPPGSTFKCSKCGTSNTTPQASVSKPPSRPTIKPAKIKPGVSRPVKSIAKTQNSESTEPDDLTKAERLEILKIQAEQRAKKSRLITIGAIVGGILVLIIFFALTGGSSNKTSSPEPVKKNQVPETPPLAPEPPKQWIVDQKVKAEVETIIKKLKDLDPADPEYPKLRLALQNMQKPAIPALIELINAPEDELALAARKQLEFRVNVKFDPVNPDTGETIPRAKLYDKWKSWWLQDGETFQLPDRTQKIFAPVTSQPKKPDQEVKKKPEEILKPNAALKTEIEGILQTLKDLNDEQQKAAIAKIKSKDKKDLIPILILEIENIDDWVATFASDILKELTNWDEAPNITQMVPLETRIQKVDEWIEWWQKNMPK